jgi:hypothetical protein
VRDLRKPLIFMEILTGTCCTAEYAAAAPPCRALEEKSGKGAKVILLLSLLQNYPVAAKGVRARLQRLRKKLGIESIGVRARL